ncbi:uncharacterized protein LOC124168086 [Ischnura elegans]|uniref:uncharacterized protein LOC124168086 n=1 Tax=Ischnura elegans TaxID=197161 RepID=UPI001ED8B7ED|nr:uncharacterized protein LOC124168086 [Ischnura elegans]XP_046402152.1 uncharacterized protein LOC124168086 [Ischnura elegans]XP_046402153.1 uncharacterized protein LOC124168086 [Ischnura elegans]XP_046402154.1 uncharacterized protein LOC124168086 [Ischnura elegans]
MDGEDIGILHDGNDDSSKEPITEDPITGEQGREDVLQLRDLLGLRDEDIASSGALVVAGDKWDHLRKRFPPNGATRLMLAAQSGDKDRVHLLLRCGANVDDLDETGKSALDYAVEHPEITLLLLQWDSIIPVRDNRAWMTDPVIKLFLAERDKFHRLLLSEEDEKVIEAIRTSECNSMLAMGKGRRWVNSEGKSALYTVIKERSSSYKKMWVLLIGWNFVYATKDEKEYGLPFENDPELRRCVSESFVTIQGYHVEKMSQKALIYRGELSESSSADTVKTLFREIDEEEYASAILQCLQDDPSLEIVLDFSACKIGCMYPSNYGDAWGLTDFNTNRIYAGAKESSSEGFERSDVLSNLTHELAHKAFADVFENRGLPYKKVGDEDSQEYYEEVVSEIFSRRSEVTYDPIIARALYAEHDVAKLEDLSVQEKHKILYELIVRVPEMIVKYKKSCKAGNANKNGLTRLQEQVPGLMEFYENQVVPGIQEHIERNKKAGKAVGRELLKTPHLLSAYWREKVNILWAPNEISDPLISPHKELRVLVVSNLSLGISHLKYSSPNEKIMFVDWSKYLNDESYFGSAVNRLDITTFVILWDDLKEVPLCKRPCVNRDCPGKMLKNDKKIVERTILMVPKRLCPKYPNYHYNDYKWKNLSMECKEQLRKKTLNLGGKEMELIDIVKGGCGGNEEKVETFLHEKFDEEDISDMVNRRSMEIGRPLDTMLMERWKEMLHDHTDCFESRELRLRVMKWDRNLINTRKEDAFVFLYTEVIDLESLNLGSLTEWDCSSQNGARFYSCSLRKYPDEVHYLIAKILRKLMDEALNKRWKYIHFFRLEGGESVNLCSFKCHLLHAFSDEILPSKFAGISLLKDAEWNEALVITDAPGSGKSVFINDLARRCKKEFPDTWVEVVDLPQFDKFFKELKGEISSKEETSHVLYDIIKWGSDSVEEKIFKLFCDNRKKVFIFFDGFDEICPESRQVVTSFLKALVNTTPVQVVVAARTHECQHLEESLSTLAYSLVPFDKIQQVRFMRKEWMAYLLMLPEEEMSKKIDIIANCLETLGSLKTEDKPLFVKSLRRLRLSRKKDILIVSCRFDALAAELMAAVESEDSEEKLTEIPLHAWMLSSVTFEDNFNVLESLSVSVLYQRFFDIKMRVFLTEKEKLPDYEPSKATPFLTKIPVREFLKEMSAFLFTEDKEYEYELDSKERMVILRVGLVRERQGRIVFVHQTFAEYFFSIWLLEKAKTEKITKLLLSSVLLLRKYEAVRQFMDCILRSETTSNAIALKCSSLNSTLKIAQMNTSGFPPSSWELIRNLQMCIYTSILECNRGILAYICRNSGEYLQRILFEGTIWVTVSEDHSIYPLYHIGHISDRGNNAFFFLRQCLSDFLFRSPRRNTYYLMTLNKMLTLSRDHGLIWEINSLLAGANLWWMGLEEYDLLRSNQGRKQFKAIFEFLIENKDVLGETLIKILDKYQLCKLRTVAVFEFEIFVYFLDSISPDEEFENKFILGDDFHEIVFRKVRSSPCAEVEEMWSFLVGKLSMEQVMDFLAAEKWNVLLAAFLNKVDESVLQFVWMSLKSELQEEQLKRLIFDATSDEPKHFPSKITNEDGDVFYKWLRMVLSDGSITLKEGIQILIQVDKYGKCFMFRHPSLVFAFQEYLSQHPRGSQVLSDVEKRFYDRLAECCLITENWRLPDFVEHVETSWRRLRPSLHDWLDYFVEEDDGLKGYLRHVSLESNRHQVPALVIKAYVVLLERQLVLERTVFGEERFLSRKVDNWKFEERNFPVTLCSVCDDTKRTTSVFVGLFFSVLAQFVPMSVVEQMLVPPSAGQVQVLFVVQSMMRFENRDTYLQDLANELDKDHKDISSKYLTFDEWLALDDSD